MHELSSAGLAGRKWGLAPPHLSPEPCPHLSRSSSRKSTMLLRSSTVLMYRLSRSSSRCWSWRDFRASAGTACLQRQPRCPIPLRDTASPPPQGSGFSTGGGEGFWGQRGQSLSICGGLLATLSGWMGGRVDRWVGE